MTKEDQNDLNRQFEARHATAEVRLTTIEANIKEMLKEVRGIKLGVFIIALSIASNSTWLDKGIGMLVKALH